MKVRGIIYWTQHVIFSYLPFSILGFSYTIDKTCFYFISLPIKMYCVCGCRRWYKISILQTCVRRCYKVLVNPRRVLVGRYLE